jgi:hypothetical protein
MAVGAGRPVAWKRYETGDAVRGLRRSGGGARLVQQALQENPGRLGKNRLSLFFLWQCLIFKR